MSERRTAERSAAPQDSFSVWQRLLRGYGPLAALVVVLLLMSILVPSKTQPTTTVGAGGSNGAGGLASSTPGGGSGPAGASGPGVPGSPGSAGVGATTGASGGSGPGGARPGAPAAAAAGKCPDRAEQVPGDPYSPPCFTFSGSNGGVTSQGVTADSIHVAYRVTSDKGFQQTLAQLAGAQLQDSQADIERTIQAIATYFNTHYQFYGRKIVVDFYNGQGQLTNELLGQGQAAAEADATTVAKQMKSFADISAESEPYADALARQHIIGLGDPYMSQHWHEQHAPYIWSIAVDGTKVADFAAEYTAKKLCPTGSPATYAGGNLKNKPRKAATLAPENSWYQESVQAARQVVSAAHCDPGENIQYQLDLGTMSNQASNIIAKLQSDGVTTIVCGCDPILPVFLSGTAARQNYFPEFIITGTALTDQDIVGQLWNQQFAAHALGISPNSDPVPSTQSIGYAAYKTVRPDEPAFGVDLVYYQLAELAIGLEMAGPNLSPQTYQAGMFAYPPRVGPAGQWGFGKGDFTTTDDVREICWSPNAISKYNQKKGAYLGTSPARWTVGIIPGGPPGCPIPSS